MIQNYSPSFSFCSCPCSWSPSWEIYSSWVSSLALTCTPPHTSFSPMSFNDICLSTTMIPKMLMNIQAENQSITNAGCLTQIYFVLVLASLGENFLLAIMAYDHYVAFVTPWGKQSSWTPASVDCWSYSPCLLALCIPSSTVWRCCSWPSAQTWISPSSFVKLFKSSSFHVLIPSSIAPDIFCN